MSVNETSRRWALRAITVIAMGIVGCSSPDDVSNDASPDAVSDSATDTTPADAAQTDAAQTDVPPTDAVQTDVMPTDVSGMDRPAIDAPTADVTVMDATVADAPRPDVAMVDAPRPDVAMVDTPRPDTGTVDVVAPPDTSCAGAFTVRVTAPTAMQEIETCTVSGMPVFFNFTAEPSSAATSVEFAWRTPEGTLAPPAWPAVTAAPFVARRQVGGMMVDVPPLAVLSRRSNWTVEVTARDRCGRTAMTMQAFTLIYTNRGCPNP